MLAQALPVATPAIDWAGLVPLIILGGGALLLVMFRSVVKALPPDVEPHLITAMGPLTVFGAAVAVGVGGNELPLAGSLGTGAQYVVFVVAMGAAAWLVRWLDLSLDAAITIGLGLSTLAGVAGIWDDRVQESGPFNAIGTEFGVDGFSLVITGVIAAAVVLVALLLDSYLEREGMAGPEMYVLMLLSALGGVVMAGANDLILLFLGIETLSIAVYVMAAMHLRRLESQEAGLKYFVLGAFSSAFLLYGIALVYGATGSTNLIEISNFVATRTLLDDGLLMFGFALLLVGLGFKVAAAPFHAWTPDVYQGSPTPVVAFMASAVKAAGFAALVRVFMVTFSGFADDWQPAIYGLAVVTLIVGSFAAVVQRDAKRMLAYSSISHAGFILVAVQAASPEGIAAIAFYAVAYAFLVIGSFAVLSVVSGVGDRGTSLDHLNGLAGHRPGLAFAFTVFLLAQAGVPLTTGFVAKFEVIAASIEARSFWLAVVAMITAVVSAFLYLRIMLSMYLGERDEEADPITVPRPAALAIALAVVVTVGFGVFPGPLDGLARDAVPVLVAGLG